VAPNNSSAWRGPYRGDFLFSPPIPRISKPIETFISSPVSPFVTHQPIRVTHKTLAHSQTPQFVGRIKARTNPILAKLPPKKRSEIGFADNELANDPPQMTGEEAPSEQVVFAQKVQGATPVGTLPQKSPRTFTQPKSRATGGNAQPLIPEAPQFTVDSLPNVTVTDSGRTLVGRTRARTRGLAQPVDSDKHKSEEASQEALPLRQQNEPVHGEVLSSPTHINKNLQGATTEAQSVADKPEVSQVGATGSSTVNAHPVSFPTMKSWRPKISKNDTQDPAKNQAHQTITPLDDTRPSPPVISSEPSTAENSISPVSPTTRSPESNKTHPHNENGEGNRSSHKKSLPSQLAGPVSPNHPINTGTIPSSLASGEGLVQRRKSQPDGPQTLDPSSQFQSEPMLAKSGSLITEPADTHSTDDPVQSPRKVVQPQTVPTIDATAILLGAKAEVLTVPADVHSAVTSVMGSSPKTVSVHRGARVQQKADTLNADAFTQNGEVHIPGDLPLTSSPMKRLLAHELTHVVQQLGQVNTKSEHSPLGQLLETQALEVETAHSIAETMPVTLPTLTSESLAPARDQQPVYQSSLHSHSFMPSSRGGKPINSLTRVVARPAPSASNLTVPANIVRPLADGTASTTTTSLSDNSRGGGTVGSDSSAITGPPVNNSGNSSPLTSPVPTPVSESSNLQRRQKKISTARPRELATSSTTDHIPQHPADKKPSPEIDTVRETKPIETSIDRDWLERHAEALYPLIKKYLRNDLLKDRERRGKLMRDN
jgi:hypothetical protein